MKASQFVLFLLCALTANGTTLKSSLRKHNFGAIVKNHVKFLTGRDDIYDRITRHLSLRSKLGETFLTPEAFCEKIKEVAPGKFFDAVEFAAKENCSFANSCLLNHYQPMPNLYSLYGQLVEHGSYASLFCIVQQVTPNPETTSADEFMEILHLVMNDEVLQNNGAEIYPNLTENYDIVALMGSEEFGPKLKELLLESIKFSDLGFFVFLIRDFVKVHPLSTIKFEVDESEMGILRSLFAFNKSFKSSESVAHDIVKYLIVDLKQSFDYLDIVSTVLDLKGHILLEHLNMLMSTLQFHVLAIAPTKAKEYLQLVMNQVADI